MKDLTKLYETKFIEQVITSYRGIYPNPSKIINTLGINPFELTYGTLKEKYIKINIANWWNLNGYLKRLDYFSKIIEAPPPPEYLEALNVSEDEFYQIEYCNYLIHLTAILDQVAYVIKDVYEMRITPSEMNYRKVLSSIKKKNKACHKKLTNLINFLKPYKWDRNIIAHKGGYLNTDIEEIGSYTLGGLDKHILDKEVLIHFEIKKSDSKGNFIKSLTETKNNMITLLEEIFLTLGNEYIKRKK